MMAECFFRMRKHLGSRRQGPVQVLCGPKLFLFVFALLQPLLENFRQNRKACGVKNQSRCLCLDKASQLAARRFLVRDARPEPCKRLVTFLAAFCGHIRLINS